MEGAARTTKVEFKTLTCQIALEILDNPMCLEAARSILDGKKYPHIECIKEVQTVVDIGANIGAASLYFARHYPVARLYAFEPCPEAYRLLCQNLADVLNIQTYQLGLFDRDCHVPLYLSREGAVTNSVGRRDLNSERSVEIDLRNAGQFFRQMCIDRIDILKLDSEGCEVPILQSLSDFLPNIKVIYVVYHNEPDRLAMDALLNASHILSAANVRHPHRGELCYVAYRSFPSDSALDGLRIKRNQLPSIAPVNLPAELIQSLPTASEKKPERYDVAVVTPTTLRPTLKQAVQSVFAQRFDGTGQLLLGIDQVSGDRKILDELLANRPPHWTIAIFDPGYSTSVRHGGLHAARDGGALRTILSYAANSRFVAYLDDDNAWSADHLASLLKTIAGFDWAYSARWFADPETLEPLCEDIWESVGPDRGVFRESFGGFVDPNSMLIDKQACESVLRWWAVPMQGDVKGMSADRNVFSVLRTNFRGVATRLATCYYRLDPSDGLHGKRMEKIQQTKAVALR